MKSLWWKLLAVALMLYVVLAGFLIPLKPGVLSVSPLSMVTGQQQILDVKGYNTHFSSAKQTKAWLRLNPVSASDPNRADTAMLASKIEVLNEQEIRLYFDVPMFLPNSKLIARSSLLIDNEIDGAFVLPSAIEIVQDKSAVGPPSLNAWQDQIQNLSENTSTTFPFRALLSETIRNQYFHVSLWFALMIIMLAAAVYAIRYLISKDPIFDYKSEALTKVGLIFGALGLVTGMVWANYTWGKPWSGDVKQNMTAIALLIYFAYFILRASITSDQQASRLAAAYNIFAFVMLIPLLYIIPRMRSSLHPGAGGNPGFGGEDLDNTMRMVFYPGVIGFTLVGIWLAQITWRLKNVNQKLQEKYLR